MLQVIVGANAPLPPCFCHLCTHKVNRVNVLYSSIMEVSGKQEEDEGEIEENLKSYRQHELCVYLDIQITL